MPVLLKSENSAFFKLDVETLITDVRERLCLKSSDKFCPSSHRRSAPYHVRKPSVHVCDRCSGKFIAAQESFQSQAALKYRSSCGICAPSKNCLSAKRYEKDRSCHHSLDLEDPHVLLQKLIAEQSLIQEAVRRLKSQKAPSSRSAMFSFEPSLADSCEQLSNHTPRSSFESEDDSLSQHSVDL